MADRYEAARKHLREADPVLARLIDEHPDFGPRAWMQRLPRMDAFGALLFQIVRAAAIGAQHASNPRPAGGPVRGRFPEPQEILDLDPEALRRAGMSRRKAETLHALAERFAGGELSDQFFRQRSDQEIEAALPAIPGVGPWTVHGFLIIALERPDVVLAGDLALRRAVRSAYGLDHIPTEQEVLQLAERWRPYRSLAVAYPFAAEFQS
jgi:DNA-3-methyladenine glycosylase II